MAYLLLQQSFICPKKFQHEVDCNLELLTPLGIDIKKLKKFEPRLFIFKREKELLFELKKRNIQPKNISSITTKNEILKETGPGNII